MKEYENKEFEKTFKPRLQDDISKKLSFQKLTPTNNVENEVYFKAIDYAFENSDVNNIAISGPLGSGKTSVLSTYEKNNPDRNFIKISLASFQENQEKTVSNKSDENPVEYDPEIINKESNDTTDKTTVSKTKKVNKNSTKNDDSEAMLEGKIINHLIHQIPRKNIPQTFFSTKEDIETKDIFSVSLVIVVLIISVLHILFRTQWNNFTSTDFNFELLNHILPLTAKPESYLFSIIVSIVLFFITIFFVVKIQKTKHILKRLNLQGNEIEVFEDKEDSHFDKHLNEMLYLLRHAKADAIVFEDLDRFDSNHIFVQLREINLILNSKINLEQKNKKRNIVKMCLQRKFYEITYGAYKLPKASAEIKFFYLLRDDIFSPKDRTKFFDFIIPIVPIVSFSNSFNIFLKIFDESHIKDKIENEFLRKVSLYINDMRIIKNICNEFFVYYETLKEINLDHNKMLAIIIYKNLFPKDFVELLSDKGFVADFLNGKNLEFESIDTSSQYNDVYEFSYFPLLKYLLSDGYIDKTYPDYISYFYPNDITRNDKLFVRSVVDRFELAPTHSLDNPKKVLENLNVADFGKKEILNYELFDYLLSIEERDSRRVLRKRDAFINQIKETENYDFIKSCFQYIIKENSLKVIIKRWPSLFSELYNNGIDKDILHTLSERILLILDLELIRKANYDGCLEKYVSENYGLISENSQNIRRLITSFKYLNVKLNKVNKNCCNLYIDEIHKHSLYEINMDNIALMLQRYCHISNIETIRHECYSCINSRRATALYVYISKNLDSFMSKYLQFCNGIIRDTEKDALIILNSATISVDNKKRYIEYLETKLFDISSIKSKNLWPEVLHINKMMSTEENILQYFSYVKTIDDKLKNFINSYDPNKTINFSKFLDMHDIPYDNKTRSELYKATIVCNSLNDERYIQILTTSGYKVDDFNYSGISKDKIVKLIDNGLIPMNPKSIQFIRGEYPYSINCFVEKNISNYVEIVKQEDVPASEINYVLSSAIKDNYKLKIIDNIQKPISVKGLKISEIVKEAILRKKLDKNDLKELCKNYDSEKIEIQDIIFDYVKNNIEESKNYIDSGAFSLHKKLFEDETLILYDKIKVFDYILEGLTKDEARKHLEIMGFNEVARVLEKNRRPRIPANAENKQILDFLKRKDWIKSYRIDPDGKYYKCTKG